MKRFLKYSFAFLFVLAGSFHFIRPEIYFKIMPPYIPWPLFMVYLSGFFEILFGILLLFRQSSRFAAWGLILLLLAVFPANINMALNPQDFPQIPFWVLLARLPLQFLLIYFAFIYTKDSH